MSFRSICSGESTNIQIGFAVNDVVSQCQAEDSVYSCFGRTQRELRYEAYREGVLRESNKGSHVRQKGKWVKLRIVTIHLGGKPKNTINLPVVFHRPVDPDAIVKYATVCVKRNEGVWQYSLMLTVQSKQVSRTTGNGIVCVSLGANIVNKEAARTLSAISSYDAGGDVVEGDMRVGVVLGGLDEIPLGQRFDKYWGENVSLTNISSIEHIGDTSGRDISGMCELFIPMRSVRFDTGKKDRIGKSIYAEKKLSVSRIMEDRQSRIDTEFRSIIQVLSLFIDDNESILPGWFSDETETINQWRNPGRLVSLYWKWKDDRFSSDSDVFQLIEEWVTKHSIARRDLGRFRQRFERNRLDFYRRIARHLASKYEICCVPNIKWAEQLKDFDAVEKVANRKLRGKKESDTENIAEEKKEAARKHRIQKAKRSLLKSAAPFSFQQALKEAFGKHRYREIAVGKPACIRCGGKVKIETGNVAVCEANCSGESVVVDVLASSVINLYRQVITDGVKNDE